MPIAQPVVDAVIPVTEPVVDVTVIAVQPVLDIVAPVTQPVGGIVAPVTQPVVDVVAPTVETMDLVTGSGTNSGATTIAPVAEPEPGATGPLGSAAGNNQPATAIETSMPRIGRAEAVVQTALVTPPLRSGRAPGSPWTSVTVLSTISSPKEQETGVNAARNTGPLGVISSTIANAGSSSPTSPNLSSGSHYAVLLMALAGLFGVFALRRLSTVSTVFSSVAYAPLPPPG